MQGKVFSNDDIQMITKNLMTELEEKNGLEILYAEKYKKP